MRKLKEVLDIVEYSFEILVVIFIAFVLLDKFFNIFLFNMDNFLIVVIVFGILYLMAGILKNLNKKIKKMF